MYNNRHSVKIHLINYQYDGNSNESYKEGVNQIRIDERVEYILVIFVIIHIGLHKSNLYRTVLK